MPSQYDAFWRSRRRLLEEMVQSASLGKRGLRDVSTIIQLGNRKSWYGRVAVRGRTLIGGEMAHAKSLGRAVIAMGLCNGRPDRTFVFTVQRDLQLCVSCESVSQPMSTGRLAAPESVPRT